MTKTEIERDGKRPVKRPTRFRNLTRLDLEILANPGRLYQTAHRLGLSVDATRAARDELLDEIRKALALAEDEENHGTPKEETMEMDRLVATRDGDVVARHEVPVDSMLTTRLDEMESRLDELACNLAASPMPEPDPPAMEWEATEYVVRTPTGYRAAEVRMRDGQWDAWKCWGDRKNRGRFRNLAEAQAAVEAALREES